MPKRIPMPESDDLLRLIFKQISLHMSQWENYQEYGWNSNPLYADAYRSINKIPGLKNNLLSVTRFFYHSVGIARSAFNNATGGH